MDYQDKEYEKMFKKRDEFREIEMAVQQAVKNTFKNERPNQKSIKHNNSRNIPTKNYKLHNKKPNPIFKRIVALALVALLGTTGLMHKKDIELVGQKIMNSGPTAHSNNLIDVLKKHLIKQGLGKEGKYHVELTSHPSDVIDTLNITEENKIILYLLKWY